MLRVNVLKSAGSLLSCNFDDGADDNTAADGSLRREGVLTVVAGITASLSFVEVWSGDDLSTGGMVCPCLISFEDGGEIDLG